MRLIRFRVSEGPNAAFHSYEPRMQNSNLEIRFACSFGRSHVSCTFFQALIGRGVRRAERTRGCQWVPYDSSGLRSYTPRLTVYSHPTVLVKREKSIQCTLRPQAKHWKASELAVVSVIARCCAPQVKDWSIGVGGCFCVCEMLCATS